MRPVLIFLLSVLSVPSAALVFGSEPSVAWPQFRGPSGAGILSDGKLPTTWSTKDNVEWSIEVKGRGWSSPVAWNNAVFVTSAN
jgi:outer membrane protein assembly factor BamB